MIKILPRNTAPAVAIKICPPRIATSERVCIPQWNGGGLAEMANDLSIIMTRFAEFATVPFFVNRWGVSENAVYGIKHRVGAELRESELVMESVTIGPEHDCLSETAKELTARYGSFPGYALLSRLGYDVAAKLGVPAYAWARSLTGGAELRILRGLDASQGVKTLIVSYVEAAKSGRPLQPLTRFGDEWSIGLPEGFGIWVNQPDNIRILLKAALDIDRPGSLRLKDAKMVRFALSRATFSTEAFMLAHGISSRVQANEEVKRLREVMARLGLILGTAGRAGKRSHFVVQMAQSGVVPVRVWTNLVSFVTYNQAELLAKSGTAKSIGITIHELAENLAASGDEALLALAARIEKDRSEIDARYGGGLTQERLRQLTRPLVPLQ